MTAWARSHSKTSAGRPTHARRPRSSPKCYQKIITSRLYEALSPDARDAARRLAVSELPLPVDAVAKIVEAGAGALEPSLNACVAFGLLQRFDEAGRPSLYHPPGLLRPWLSDPECLPEKDARAIDRRLSAFWRLSFETDREAELRVLIDVEVAACRVHARRGGDIPTFRARAWVTTRRGSMRCWRKPAGSTSATGAGH